MSVFHRMGRSMMRLACLGIVSGALVGCNQTPSSGNRISVAGKVTLDGTPIVKANIIFQPVNGTNAQGAGGDVYNGEYKIPTESGPTPGQKYKVTVMTQPEKFLRNTVGEKKGAGGAPAAPPEKQYILEKVVDIPQKDTTSLDLAFEKR